MSLASCTPSGRGRLPGRQERCKDKVIKVATSLIASAVVGLCDRAVIGTLLYTFARVGAATALRVEDYFPQGKRRRVRLHEADGGA